MLKLRMSLSMAGILVACCSGYAADGVDLGQIMVSATKTEALQGEVGSATTVVTSRDIKKSGKTMVVEVLRDIPGLTVASSGALGGATSVYLRGADAGYTLVMIDGVEVNDPMSTDRSFNFANLSTDNVERIEVVRGPQSTLYGADAIAGVINIITKKGSGAPRFAMFSEAGAHNTFSEGVSLSGGRGKWEYLFSGSRLDSSGISSAFGGAEPDGYKNSTLSSRVGYKFSDNTRLETTGRLNDTTSDADDGSNQDDPNNVVFERNISSKVELFNAPTPEWKQSWSFSYSLTKKQNKDLSDTVDVGEFVHSWFEGDNKLLAWQHDLSPVDWSTTTVGVEYQQERGYSDGWYDTSSRLDRRSVDNKACFLQNQFKFWDKLFITPGVRLDNNENFGVQDTYKLSSSYLITATQTRLKGNWGTGFKAPSLYQLYSSYGNAALQPGLSKSTDLGFEQAVLNNKLSFGAMVFENNFRNMVDYDFNENKYINIGQAETKGVELDIKFTPVERLKLATNFTYTDTEDKATGRQLLRRPARQFNSSADWRVSEKARLNLGVTHVGSRKDIDSLWVCITDKAFTVLRLASSFDITKDLQVFGRIENLFDKRYQEVFGYATMGRSAYGGVKLSF
ncbi:MAG: TonB-dependent receptor [Candidatus Omnitrophica bacterium]|nr:TonB-dependent receptor [Candidatus Omnitrophota bacterium]